MKIFAAVGVLAISVVVIALQLSGWSQAEPQTVNLSSTTRSAVGPPSVSSASSSTAPPVTPPAIPSSQTSGTSRLMADVRQTSEFIWPARGPLSSYFGAYHVLGIDIALDNSEDSPIVAAATGTVEFAGGLACCDYGLYVVLNHEGNRSTLYGHFSKLEVVTGQEVLQGELLGYGGSTGVSDGKHFHFELHDGGTVVDPLRYLPAAERSTQPALLRTDCTSDFLRVDPDSKISFEFADASGFRPVSVRFDDDATDAGFAAGIEGIGGISHRVSVAVPPAPSAKGLIGDATLTVMLSDGPNLRTLECPMRLATMVTMANAPRITKHPGSTSGPPGTPTATPIKSKYPTPTPPMKSGTPTPVTATASVSVSSSGASTSRLATTPPPAPMQPKSAPTVKPPQQFPITR